MAQQRGPTSRRLSPTAELPKELQQARGSFRSLIAANPNYFGNLKLSTFKPVLQVAGNTWYEELTCVGFNPERNQLNATVEIKRNSGYSGGLCAAGSKEFVRFFVDYGAGWQDAGVAGFEVHDVADGTDCAKNPTKPLTYSVSLRLDAKGDCCFDPSLPNVRAVLSWNVPSSLDPDVPPVWGNSLDVAIQLRPSNSIWCLIGQLDTSAFAKLKVSPDIIAAATGPIPLPDPPPLTTAELAQTYIKTAKGEQGAAVEPHRFGFAELHSALTGESVDATLIDTKITDWKSLGIDWSKALGVLVDTSGNVSYEQLDCLALDSEHEWLVATFTVKRPTGYSGDLCTKGSTEFVAFWADWDDKCEWTYLGTASVSVHDIASIPGGGLHYTALLRCNLDAVRRSCRETKPARVRAILSWATPPSATDPEAIPYWGNRLDSHVVVKPGPTIVSLQPIIRSLGSIPVGKLNPVTGTTIASAFFEFSLLPPDGAGRPCPFGGRVAVKGPAFVGSYYRLQVKRVSDPPASWTPLKTPLILEDFTGTVFTNSNPLNAEGFFGYTDANTNAEDILGEWDTTGDALWEVMLELATAPDSAHIVGQVIHRLQLDNTAPEVSIEIDPAIGGNCNDFNIGAVLSGRFVARDAYFGSYSLGTSPFAAPPGQLTPAGGSVQTSPTPGGAWNLKTAGMPRCGYIISVSAVDRAIINSGSVGHWVSAPVGFCLRQPTDAPS